MDSPLGQSEFLDTTNVEKDSFTERNDIDTMIKRYRSYDWTFIQV